MFLEVTSDLHVATRKGGRELYDVGGNLERVNGEWVSIGRGNVKDSITQLTQTSVISFPDRGDWIPR